MNFIEQIIKEVAKQVLGADREQIVNEYKSLIRQTPIDEVEIKEYPFVNIRINANTWVEVLLVYLVEPKHSATLRTTLIKKVLDALNQQPDKVKFPKGDSR